MKNTDSYLGKQIGNYRIIAKIASGGFGSVYQGRHILLTERIVAIKLLHAAYLNSPEDRERFLQEAHVREQLKHPYCLPLLDAGIHHHWPYLVSEYAAYGSLRNRLDHAAPRLLPMHEALTILSQVGQALGHAHQQGIVHRDLKPENILFNAQGDAQLADFGIAVELTRASIIQVDAAGTPTYMAPEQFRGEVGKQSDQYALGCVAYELFTGQPPFMAPDSIALGFLHTTAVPRRPTSLNPDLPLHIEWASLKALTKERVDRHPDIAAFIAALQDPSIAQGDSFTFATAPIDGFGPALKMGEQEIEEEDILEHYTRVLAANERIIRRDPGNAAAYLNKGYALYDLDRCEEALEAFEQAIKLKPNFTAAYLGKDATLLELQRYEEALAACEEAIRHDPTYARAHNNKGYVLLKLTRFEEALIAFERAIQLRPKYITAYRNQAYALNALGRHKEALAAYELVIHLDPNNALVHMSKAYTLDALGRTEEAHRAYEKARQLGFSEL